jgi:DNA-binding CsgD family transcriptional regulator
MSQVAIDEKTRAALGRLTAGEKECLERRLRHQTAKEMAIELGVSPHAVEKRLKMARAKLGLSSSLEAARLWAASERYQRTAPQSADLAPDAFADDTRRGPLVLGVVSMTILIAAVIALAAQTPGSGGVAPMDAGGVAPSPPTHTAPNAGAQPSRAVPADAKPAIIDRFEPEELVEATPAELGIIVRDTFANRDANRSGYIEPEEALVVGGGEVVRDGKIERTVYARDAAGNATPTGDIQRISLERARAEYIAEGDRNGDGKLDFTEFQHWQTPIIAKRGIPKAWKDDINRPLAQ